MSRPLECQYTHKHTHHYITIESQCQYSNATYKYEFKGNSKFQNQMVYSSVVIDLLLTIEIYRYDVLFQI